MSKEDISKAAYDISDMFANEKDLENLIRELYWLLKERRKQLYDLSQQNSKLWEVL